MSWPIVKIGDVSEQIRGVSYAKEDVSLTPKDGYLPVLRANNITEAGLKFDDLVYVPNSRIKQKQIINKHDVVIAASSGSLDIVGKAASALVDFQGGFGAFCKVLRPNSKIDPRYFSNYFQTKKYRQTISLLAAGANINNLKNEHLDTLEIALPPLPEQRRIAAILDKAEALRSKRREAIAKLDQLLQSVFLEMFGDPVSNPNDYPKITFGDLIKVKSGDGLVAKDMLPGEHAVYGGNGINGYHSSYTFEDSKIVIGRVGVYCGAVHKTEPKSWITDNALYVSNILKEINLTYLEYILKIANFNQYAGRAAQPLISGSRIYPVETIYPPIVEQNKFESIVHSIYSTKKKLKQSEIQSELLIKSVQHQFFS